MKNTTLLFLIKRSEGKITELCLAMKKRGFGVGRWNGVGGKVSSSETIEQAVRRETREEIGVEVGSMKKVAELSFTFPHNTEWNQLVHVYIAEEWNGKPTESEEMKPEWYGVHTLPFDSMWPDDRFWVPLMLEGNLVKGRFVFGEGDVILEKEVKIVLTL